MKNIIHIFIRDIKKVFTNWVAIIVICGLVILPATYAWFNIKSSWDPYGSTKGVKIAVVNMDQGTEFNGETINVGDKIVSELKNNDKIGWTFTTQEEANSGVKNGTYFASIEIPKDFSNNLTSPITNTIVKPQLIYTVNEITNAIAPKITNKGVETLKSEVDKNVSETINGAIFRALNEIGIEYMSFQDKARVLVDTVYTLNDNLPQIGQIIDQAYSGTISVETFNNKLNSMLPNFETLLTNVDSVLTDGKKVIVDTKDNVHHVAPLIKDDLVIANQIIDTTISSLNNISKDDALKILQGISTKVGSIEKTVESNRQLLESINKILHNNQLANTIETLKQVEVALKTLQTELDKTIEAFKGSSLLDPEAIQSIQAKLQGISDSLTTIINSYDTQIMPAIDASLSKMDEIANQGTELVGNIQNILPDVKDISLKLATGIKLTHDELGIIKQKFPAFQQSFGALVDKIKSVDNEKDIDKVLDVLMGDWKERASFIASPVDIETNQLFAVPNYGSAMSPFYTTLALWVGGLILISILTLDPKPLDGATPLKPIEKYFGKFLFFAFIALLQGATVTLGDIFILKAYVVNPTYFVLFGMLTSLVFVTIIYSTVSVFGNVGKAICIIFLVLQVAASGGTFPVQVMSEFFQKINPYLPFKYAIDAMRGFVGGMVPELILRDIIVLLAYAFGFMIFALILKPKANILAEHFHHKAAESGILEH